MPRYIDADNIKLKGISVFDQNLEILIPLSDVRKSLQMTPTADVVEVVRCKDCKFRGTDDCLNSYYSEYEGAYVDPMDDNGFCSYGIPKERGGEK